MVYVALKDPRVTVTLSFPIAEFFWRDDLAVYAATPLNLSYMWGWWHSVLNADSSRQIFEQRQAIPSLTESQRQWLTAERVRLNEISPFVPQAPAAIDAIYALIASARADGLLVPITVPSTFRLYEPPRPPELDPFRPGQTPCPDCDDTNGSHAFTCPLSISYFADLALAHPDPLAWVKSRKFPHSIVVALESEIIFRTSP